MKHFLTLFFFVGFASLCMAQNVAQIRGFVTDSLGTNIELATLVLQSTSDSLAVATQYSNQDGSFLFSEVPQGKYVIVVRYLGFEPYTTASFVIDKTGTELKIPTIVLKSNIQLLKEVGVTAQVPFVVRKLDRTVINPSALIANAGSNVLEALERSPGISVDPSGLIKLKGRSGVQIFIDDKPTYVSGEDLANLLRSMPADNIKQIDIMTNPPAKYGAAGNSGVINIITKRNKQPGFNGNVNMSVARGYYTRSNNSINLNVNRKHFSIFSNVNVGIRNSFQDLNINRYYKNEDLSPESSFSQNSYIVKRGQSLSGKIGIDYYLSPRTTIGFVANGLTNPNSADTDNKAIVRDAQSLITKRVNADNTENGDFNNRTYNLNLRHNLDSVGSNIVFDADYVRYNTTEDQLFKNYIYDTGGNLTYQDLITGRLPSGISIYAAKADYTKTLKKGGRFEAGVKSAYTQTDNEAAYANTVDGFTSIDYNLSNRFLYDEWIHAAYLNYSTTIKQFDFQMGLRAENTRLFGNQLGNVQKPSSTFTRDYTSLFPTVYAAWRMDTVGKHTLTFSYGRRIDRPFFQDLNPFISPLDKFTFYAGNPNLLPTFSHNFSLAHSYMGFLNTSLNVSATVDGINETLEINDGIYYSRPGNIANSQTVSLSVDAGFPVTKWYNINTYCEGGRMMYQSNLYNQKLNSSGNYGYFSLNNGFQLGKGWSSEVRGEYQTDIVVAQLLIKSYGTLNVGVAKKVLKNKGTLKLNGNDLLYTRRSDGIINNLERTDADWNSDLDSRSASLSFSYAFGKNNNQRPKHTGSGSESERNRVKS